MSVTKKTRTENGRRQFCRGGLEAGHSHSATTYTTLHYGSRQFHFCDEHPPDVLTSEGDEYDWDLPESSGRKRMPFTPEQRSARGLK